MANKAGTLKRERWTSADMEKAMQACREERRGLRAAAREHGLSAATLKRHLDGVNKNATGSTRQLGRGSVLPLEAENELMTTILDLEKRFFGLSRNEVMTVLTSTPHKKKLVDAQQKRDDIIEKKRKAVERKAALENQRQKKQSKGQKTTCPVEQKKDRKKANTAKKPQSKSKVATNTQKLSSGKNVENPDWYCFMCTECTVKDMIQCQGGCRRWVHCSCARCGSAHYYYCDVCFAGTE